VFRRFSACVVKRNVARSQMLVASTPASAEEQRAVRGLNNAMTACLGKAASKTNLYGVLKMSFAAPKLRGGLAEQLYRLYFAARPPVAAPRPAAVAPILALEGAAGETLGQAVSYAVAQCGTAAQPGRVHAIIMVPAGSAEEKTHFRSLRPALSTCLTRGSTFSTNRETLRGYLAESVYRWSLAQPGAAPAAPAARN
jgi:hypothetical protein